MINMLQYPRKNDVGSSLPQLFVGEIMPYCVVFVGLRIVVSSILSYLMSLCSVLCCPL